MSKAADLAGYQIALKTALIEFTDGDDAIAVADAGVVTLLTTAVAKSEGGAVTTNIAQGLAKHWVIFPPSATADDSFNNSGITDNSAGDFSLARTTNLGSANYSTQINGDTTNGSDAGLTSHFADNRNLTSSVTRCVFLRSTDFAAYDADGMCATIHGDLA